MGNSHYEKAGGPNSATELWLSSGFVHRERTREKWVNF
jgi:hypothetical protein